MLGLVKKDFLIMKSSIKGMAIIFILYIAMAFNGMFELPLILPLLGMILLVSTISYDEQSNFYAYACTLPNGRRNIVKSKYLFSLLIIAVCGMLSVLVTSIVGYAKGNLDIISNVSSLVGSICGIVLVVSFIYPLMFKFGAEKGRIYLFVLVFGGVVLVSALSRLIEISNLKDIFNSMSEVYFYIILFFIVSLILFISYRVSKSIMLRKEF